MPLVQKVGAHALEAAPLVLAFLNAHPNGLLDKWLTKLSNKYFRDGYDKFPPVDPALADDLASKPTRKIDETVVPRAYVESIRNTDTPPAEKISTIYSDGRGQATLHLKKYVKHEESGFRGAIYQDGDGHAIVFFSGMDVKAGGNLRDFEAIVQTKMMKNSVNRQTPHAQELYLEAVREAVSVEIVAYSLGSMLASDLAARLGAQVTAFADIGLPDRNHMYTDEQISRIKPNVLSLWLLSDLFAGKAGPVHGTVINLPAVEGDEVLKEIGTKTKFNARSTVVAHDPKAYMLASEKNLPVVLGASPDFSAMNMDYALRTLERWADRPAANADSLHYAAS
jgi:hypothetical protein